MKEKKGKRFFKEAVGEIVCELIVTLLFFGIGVLAVILFGGEIDAEELDFDLIALIGCAVVLVLGGGILALVYYFRSKRKKSAENVYTGVAVADDGVKDAYTFCFTVDDNIRVLREICERGYPSIFDHPYLAMYRRLNAEYGVKVQLNLFYEDESFNLSMMTDRYRAEWRAASSWLKLSFHSRRENLRPYESAGYDEVYGDAMEVKRQIIRFATEDALAQTTTVHYCLLTEGGRRAMAEAGVRGLLGLYGTAEHPRNSYGTPEDAAAEIRGGATVTVDGIAYAAINLVLNSHPLDEIRGLITPYLGRRSIKVMIHEQYFYSDYKNYQEDFEEKLKGAFDLFRENGYRSIFFEELL